MIESIKQIDKAVFYFINDTINNSVFDLFMPIIRDRLTWVLLYIYILYFLIKKYKYKSMNYIILIVISVVFSNYFNSEILKVLIERIRPCNYLGNVKLLVYCSNTYSMPSTHSVNHFVLATFFANIFDNKKSKIIMYLWATSICLAQVYVGVHYPLDVVVGGFLGYGFASLMIKIYNYLNLRYLV